MAFVQALQESLYYCHIYIWSHISVKKSHFYIKEHPIRCNLRVCLGALKYPMMHCVPRGAHQQLTDLFSLSSRQQSELSPLIRRHTHTHTHTHTHSEREPESQVSHTIGPPLITECILRECVWMCRQVCFCAHLCECVGGKWSVLIILICLFVSLWSSWLCIRQGNH